MKLTELLNGVKFQGQIAETEIRNLEFDSRKIGRGDVFVATKGTVVDGHAFIEKAVEQGAAAVVCEELPSANFPNCQIIKVADSTDALGVMAANLFGNPSRELTLVGVTGTNGKTTIATLLYHLVRRLGAKAGLLSTVCNFVNDKKIEATHTTPNALELNRLLREMVESGCRFAFMECSSHAIEQRRIAGLEFDGAIFTNLTRDHLDYHLTVANYLKAKKRFFDDLPKTAFALTNIDDKNGEVMLQNCRARKFNYSCQRLADFKTKILEKSFEGMLLEMNGVEVMLPFVGRFNAANLTAVFGAATLLGFEKQEILTALSALKAVSGRFEAVRMTGGFTAIVDYAHTPDALKNVLETISEILCGGGNIITVVGCGGNRDKGKRPIMAQTAATLSTKIVLTSDNPRKENPEEILSEMVAGLDENQKKSALKITDRREAIKTACALAKPGDVVLVAGKGHENYQIIGEEKFHFDDKEELLKLC